MKGFVKNLERHSGIREKLRETMKGFLKKNFRATEI
jgi:hypothetical protein